MAPSPPTTCAEFFRAADAAGYSRESARWALYVAVRYALGFERDALQGPDYDDVGPDVLLGGLVSHVTDIDPRLAVLFDLVTDRTPGRTLIADAWAELTGGPRELSVIRS